MWGVAEQLGEERAKRQYNRSLLLPKGGVQTKECQIPFRGAQWKKKGQWSQGAQREILIGYKGGRRNKPKKTHNENG